jgi:hypothetical protein
MVLESSTSTRRISMNIRNLLKGIVALMALALLASCASTTSLTAVWKDPAYQGMPKKVVVVGLAKQQAIRNLFEDGFVTQLKARQIDAIASHTLVPFDQMGNRDAGIAKIKNSGADTVLVARLVDRKTVETQVAGSPYPAYYNSWGNYWGYVYGPTYVIEDEYAYLESNLYQVASEKLAWSARSETWMVASNQDLIAAFTKTIIDKLASDKIIK